WITPHRSTRRSSTSDTSARRPGIVSTGPSWHGAPPRRRPAARSGEARGARLLAYAPGAMPATPRTNVSTHPTRARSAAGARVLERLRAICLALPEANERVSHGEPTWFAGKGKVFAMFDDHHHGADRVAVWLP